MKIIIAFFLLLVPTVFCYTLNTPYRESTLLLERSLPGSVCENETKVACSSDPNDGSICCDVTETCCQLGVEYTSCAPAGGKCCSTGHSCGADEECCGTGCMPAGAVCCEDSYCPAATVCPVNASIDKCSGAEKLYGLSILIIFVIYFVIFV